MNLNWNNNVYNELKMILHLHRNDRKKSYEIIFRVLSIDYLQKGKTINPKYYSNFLNQLNEKRPDL